MERSKGTSGELLVAMMRRERIARSSVAGALSERSWASSASNSTGRTAKRPSRSETAPRPLWCRMGMAWLDTVQKHSTAPQRRFQYGAAGIPLALS